MVPLYTTVVPPRSRMIRAQVAYDKDGEYCMDAAKVLDGGAIATFGGHKGAGALALHALFGHGTHTSSIYALHATLRTICTVCTTVVYALYSVHARMHVCIMCFASVRYALTIVSPHKM
jgi:LDH2 family malate/lactate/ureidoglycolate dehydrogenase